jgi:hypothetical protein
LVTALGYRVPDAALPQEQPAARVTVAPVRDQPRRALARPPDSTGALHTYRVEYRLELGALVALARGHDHRQRPAPAVAGQMQLGR